MTIIQLGLYQTNRITMISSLLRGTKQPENSSNHHIIISSFGTNYILVSQVYSISGVVQTNIKAQIQATIHQEEPMCQGNKALRLTFGRLSSMPERCSSTQQFAQMLCVPRGPSSFSPSPWDQQDSPELDPGPHLA